MIRVHGVPISDDEASELARRLRNYRDPNGIGVAERLERGLMGMAIIGTSRPDAEAVLAVIEARTPERPRDRCASSSAELRSSVPCSPSSLNPRFLEVGKGAAPEERPLVSFLEPI
jgi:hypothetical protein